MNQLDQASAHWAKSVIDSPDQWLILDTETTGLHGDDEIVQIAAIGADGKVLLDSLVKPTCEIKLDASAIHGIYPHQVVNAPTFDQVFLDLLKAFGRRRLAIYNVDFDIRMIQQSLRPYNIYLSIPGSYWLNGSSMCCVMGQYSQWCGDWSNYQRQRLPGGDHSALGDCVATLEVIRRMAASLKGED